MHPDMYRVRRGQEIDLSKWDPWDTGDFEDDEGTQNEIVGFLHRLYKQQEMLFAEQDRSLLVVLQAMDTAGKDGTIKHVFEGLDPVGVRVGHFGIPSAEDLSHDFLWRAHREAPAKGEIVIFNRSYYEGVLVERVHKLVPEEVWRLRFRQINEFERLLNETGTAVVKFYLNIDSSEQKRRLEERLKDATKQWKFSSNDLPERKFWPEYMNAYEHVLEKTSVRSAPWYIIPANYKWYRDLAVSAIIVKTLARMKLRYPKPKVDLKSIKIV